MISGFSTTQRHVHGGYDSKNSGSLPVPFNIPNVLHNLLFEDVGIEFDAKQSDVMETLRFSQAALVRMQQKYAQKEQELVAKMLRDSDNKKYKEEYEEMQLDRFEANSYFKELVVVISDLLTREQYAKLLDFSNIPH